METTTGIFRHLHEFGRSSPLRRLLNRIAAPLARGAGSDVPERAKSESWGSAYWESGARTPAAAGRVHAAALQQTDLFGWLASDVPSRRSTASAASRERAVKASAPVSRVAQLTKAAPAQGVRKLRVAGSSAGYADRRRSVQREKIARLLEVNESVNGVRLAEAVAMPRSSFVARVDLWKGRPIGMPFVLGN
ncbi:MAG: hypothetical protein M9963_01460 [Kiritimatiellae bacterium]|nr:hypothetical protein [Kiritimatiellia bacterium]MCO6401199.1 hypothetical protein [Verrucomicrobiota bacterium]